MVIVGRVLSGRLKVEWAVSRQQPSSCVRVGRQSQVPRVIHVDTPLHVKVGRGQKTSSLLGPFADFQTGCGKHVSQTRVFPFLGVFETVKIKMPHR